MKTESKALWKLLRRRDKRPALPPGYEIRRDSRGDFLYVHAPHGNYIANVVRIGFDPIKRARKIAWNHYEGRGGGSVVERG